MGPYTCFNRLHFRCGSSIWFICRCGRLDKGYSESGRMGGRHSGDDILFVGVGMYSSLLGAILARLWEPCTTSPLGPIKSIAFSAGDVPKATTWE